MKKLICMLSITTVLVLFFTFPALAGSFDKTLIPAEAQWVMHLDMGLFNRTQLKKMMMEKNVPFLMEHETDDFFKETNIKLYEDITGITLFGINKGEKDLVLYCTGNFDIPRLLGFIDKKHHLKKEKYNRFEIQQAANNHFFVFPEKNLFLYSRHIESIKKTLDVLARKNKDISHTSLMNFIKMIPANAFLMAVANDISALGGHSPHTGAILTNTGMATFMVMENNANLQLSIVLNTLNPETAQNIEQIIKGLIAVGSMQKQDKQDESKEELFKLLTAVKITKEDKTLRLSLNYPTSALVDMMVKKNKHSDHHKKHSDHK